MSKKNRLGSDPLSFIKDTTNEAEKTNPDNQAENNDEQVAESLNKTTDADETVEAANLNMRIKQLNTNTSSLEFEGELSIYNAKVLKEPIERNLKNNNAIELDLSHINKIDTAGYQFIIAIKKEADNTRKVVKLVNPSNEVKEIFELYGENYM